MLITSHILISLAALFGLFQLFRTTSIFAKGIVLAQVAAVAIALSPIPPGKTIGFSLFGICIFASIIYVLTQKIGSGTLKGLMLLITIPVFTSFTFKMNHWPYAFELGMLMIVPIIAYIILLTRKTSTKNEIGFLTIVVAEALIEFIHILSSFSR